MFELELDQKLVVEGFTKLYNAGADTTPAMKSIARILRTRVGLGFKNQTDPYGRPWKPTARGGQILRDTGRLASSVTSVFDRDTAEAGTNVDYAAAHQYGAYGMVTVKQHTKTIVQAFGKPIPPTLVTVKAHKKMQKIPARPIFPDNVKGIPKAWAKGIRTSLVNHLKKADLNG